MPPPLSPRAVLDAAAETFLSVERETRLFYRATPENPQVALSALGAAVRTGRPYRPVSAWRGPDLSETRRRLDALPPLLLGMGAVAQLAVARAAELALEVALAEALHSAPLARLAAARFPAPAGGLARSVDALVSSALAHPPPPESTKHRSDDAADPRSLVARLRRGATEMAIPLRIEIRARQLAVAATGEGLVAVRPSVMLSRAASERIAIHELHAHALPRARALSSGVGLLRAGMARSNEHEEGRALLIEERRGYFGAERLHELALRHRAALSVRDGATPEETVRLLLGLGAAFERALDLSLRVHRGGGLARELVYLPAYFEVKAAFSAEPALEAWFERGRMSLEGARCLAANGIPALRTS
jgi:hypothetical protein